MYFIGLPTWYCIGILAVMANQFAPTMGIEKLEPGKAIMWATLVFQLVISLVGSCRIILILAKTILYMLLFHYYRCFTFIRRYGKNRYQLLFVHG